MKVQFSMLGEHATTLEILNGCSGSCLRYVVKVCGS